jgi:hypothetical protein
VWADTTRIAAKNAGNKMGLRNLNMFFPDN